MQDNVGLENFIGLDGQTALELFFLLMLGFYIIYTAVLYYHWKAYGSDEKITVYTASTYLLLTLPIIITLALITYVL